MLSARQLNLFIDSLITVNDSSRKKRNTYIGNFFHFKEPTDSQWKASKVPKGNADWLPEHMKVQVHSRALAITGELKSSLQYGFSDIDQRTQDIKGHKIEWHRKFSISFVCIILFFIGAPLGSIIRKGGLGMPLVVAIILFLCFHLLNMFGEKFVKEGLVDPVFGMWLAVIVLTPVSVFFTYKAIHDSQLFNKEFYFRMFKRIQPLVRKITNRQKPSVS
jgi:lipopolysaccharide export system permease protein